MDAIKIYRLTTGDGTTRHFPSEAEVHFAAKEARDRGTSAVIHEIRRPGDAEAFADFCDELVARRQLVSS